MKTIGIKLLILAVCICGGLLLMKSLTTKTKSSVATRPVLLLHKVTVNGKPVDSIVYNSKGHMTAIWFYDDVTGRWDAHHEYIYGTSDKVEKVLAYWKNELMEIDSLYYNDDSFTKYTVSTRASTEVTGDTLQFQLNKFGKPIRIGNTDTFTLDNYRYVSYDDLEYIDNNLTRIIMNDYYIFPADRNAVVNHQTITDIRYDTNPNPFAPLCQDYPGITRETFHPSILFSNATNNMLTQKTTDTYGSNTNNATIQCCYKYDATTLLPLEQTYEKLELDEADKPVVKYYGIQFYYKQQ
ncbi:hypothetical protein [Chitinophaga sp. Cy-1792]|uniref:hypothetical protein n=1 Tax=Chitinophaga sp. Cy-1792 TaxID=2608339 RepID=UPI00141F7A41|nr:hypothetical protein [Chitinophaga sp. Cy-1792]NIG57297.1 hypothetical protein [Chitinophaga sp. Cy-1792]